MLNVRELTNESQRVLGYVTVCQVVGLQPGLRHGADSADRRVDVVESVDRPTPLLDDLLKRVPMELDGPTVTEGDDEGLVDWALILLVREDVTMSPAELLELVTNHEADMLETHRVAGLMGRWDQFDQVDLVLIVQMNRLPKQKL